jgi:hypothetical protein
MKTTLKTAIAAAMLCFGCHTYAQSTSSIAPGSLKEVPADIVSHLESKGVLEFFSYNKNIQGDARKSLIELQKYSEGKRKFYPAEDIKGLLSSMQGIIISRDLHSGEKFVNNHTAFYSLLDIAISLCPDINLLSQQCSSDHVVGIIDFPDGYSGIFYHTVMCKVGEKKFKAHTLALPNEVVSDVNYNKIRKISEREGKKTYLISDETNFDAYVLTIGSNGKISSTKPANEEEVKTWFDEKNNNSNGIADIAIIFNPKKVCWEFCYSEGNIYKRVAGTRALYLEFADGKPAYILKQ